jgi:membrane-bound metal-dependent hydrolase YbcI (DUF457 family)
MAETFLILFAGGVMLAAAVSNPRHVTLNWLRLAGIIALALAGVGTYFYFASETPRPGNPVVLRVQRGLLTGVFVAILGQLATVQVAMRTAQRVFASAAFALAVLAGSHLLHDMMQARGTALLQPPKGFGMMLQTLSSAGVAAMTGVALMSMLLGHAYLTASQMTMAPFMRLNRVLGGVIAFRVVCAVAMAVALQVARPIEMFWGAFGLYVATRWLVGLLIPAVFVYMAHDCIKRRSTQSATGILYVAGVLIVIGELLGLYLVRETGLPF